MNDPNIITPLVSSIMHVIKRRGHLEPINFDKIHCRIKYLCREPTPLECINHTELAQLVIQGLHDGIETRAIDEYAANLAASLMTRHMEYGQLAGRIIINNCHKNTLNSFYDKIKRLYLRTDHAGKVHPLIHPDVYKFVKKHHEVIDRTIQYDRDYDLDFFAFRTLERGYLLQVNGELVERPQDLFMRVAIFIHMSDQPDCLEDIFHTYDRLSRRYYTHATPTLFNAGTPQPALSSCYLLGSHDSREGILKTLDDATQISKWSGGIGFHMSMWRAEGSLIRGTNGKSSGIVPFLKLFNAGARAFNQGGKRMGSFAAYIEPHHPDIVKFLHLRRNTGDENLRCRDLFMALWVSDLFMERVEADEQWSTFCPDQCPGLSDVYGEEYRTLYTQYEQDGKAHTVYSARTIWKMVFDSQKEAGMPYILYKDTVNVNSMQQNIGTIKSSNLCVSGSTRVLTLEGYERIDTIAQNAIPVAQVWNGSTFTAATFSQTNTQATLIRVTFSNGVQLDCTPEHIMLLKGGDRRPLKECRVGDSLQVYELPSIQPREGESIPYAYELGLLMKQRVDPCESGELLKGSVPLIESYETKRQWLAGLIDGCGEWTEYGLTITVRHPQIARDIQLMLQTLGIESRVRSGLVELLSRQTNMLHHLMLPTRKWVYYDTHENHPVECSIVSMETLPGTHPTYCFNEPMTHRGFFNGVCTGQCAEIVEYSSDSEYAVCTLASLCLPQFVRDTYTEEELSQPESERRVLNHVFPVHPVLDHRLLAQVAGELVVNLNRVIDKNWYPTVETVRSNFQHRPIGIGIQGLADVFAKFKAPFESETAKQLNALIHESIYYGCVSKSTELCRREYQSMCQSIRETGKQTWTLYPKHLLKQYPLLKQEQIRQSFESVEEVPYTVGAYSSHARNNGSPISKGIFHWELMGVTSNQLSGRFDWETVRRHIQQYGIKNSLLVALMPTASTSQIMGNTETFEPFKSNIYKRKTLAGEFIVVNRYLMHDLQSLGLWTDEVKQYLMVNNGSIQGMDGIPDSLKALYKTVWEIKQKHLIDLAVGRQPFVDQSQSLNLHMEDLTLSKFNSMQFYCWKNKLKTGCYYLRSRPAVDPQKFTVQVNVPLHAYDPKQATIEDDEEEVCLMCSA
jgi:ribonucleoside-diphosphate reductase alpha chain